MNYSLDNESIYTKAFLQKKMRSMFITIPHTSIPLDTIHNAIIQCKSIIYTKTAQEHHKDGDTHIHIYIKFNSSIAITTIHNIIKKTLIEPPKGTIDYDPVRSDVAADTYLNKEGVYLEYGEKPQRKKAGRPLVNRNNDSRNAGAFEAITMAQQGDIEGAIATLIENQPMEYLRSKESIENNLKSINITRKKYDLPNMTDIDLKPWQQQVVDLIKEPPKERRIIWISGKPGCGKSFLFNYLSELQNYEYGLYNAGQCVSLDNLAYAYDEEGIIAWDFPMNFKFDDDIRSHIANVIEKFSDFGQKISSKKYKGSTKYIRGHCVVFSNKQPLYELKHRDIIHINTDNLEIISSIEQTINTEILYNNNTESVLLEDDGTTLPQQNKNMREQYHQVYNNAESKFEIADYITVPPNEYPIDYNKLIEEVKAAEEVFKFEQKNKERADRKRMKSMMQSIKKELSATTSQCNEKIEIKFD
jgi:energy-coupling factor transporter ATP-binding protein EcfA2